MGEAQAFRFLRKFEGLGRKKKEIHIHQKKKESFMKIQGKNNLETAMSKTVGLPIALLIELLIKKNHDFRGVILPFDEIIYNPLLNKLEDNGIAFNHRTSNIQKYP